MNSEEEFYAGVTPENIYDRLDRVQEPLKWRITGDLCVLQLMSFDMKNAKESYEKAAMMGDCFAMLRLRHYFFEHRYDVIITPDHPIAYKLLMFVKKMQIFDIEELDSFAKDSLFVMDFLQIYGLKRYQKELEAGRYLPAANMFLASEFQNRVARAKVLHRVKDTWSPLKLARFAVSEPRQTWFIAERLSQSPTKAEVYFYATHGLYLGFQDLKEISKELDEWLSTFSCSLLRLQTFPKDVRLLLARYAWDKRFEHLEQLL